MVDFPRHVLLAIGFSLATSACGGWTDEVVIQVRDPSLVTVQPANRDPRRGEIPAGRSTAVMKAIDADPASLWLARARDASISSFGSVANETDTSADARDIWRVDLREVLSPQGQLHLAPENKPPFRLADLARGPNSVVHFPGTFGRSVVTKRDTETTTHADGTSVTTTRTEYASARDAVIFSSPASNIERGYYYSRPSRFTGAMWLIGGLVIDGLGLYVLEKSRAAKHNDTIDEDAMPAVYGITGALFAIGLPFELYGSYLLLAPEKRAPLP
jgi:hypothetical protein